MVRLTDEIRQVGKAHLSPALCSRLQARRELVPVHDRLTHAVLDCVLDKHEDRYLYGSYIAAPVLALVEADLPDRRTLLLQALLVDLALHELAALRGPTGALEVPDERLVSKRVRHATRLVAEIGGRRTPRPVGDTEAARRWFAGVRAEIGARLSREGVDLPGVLAGSLLPVDVYHDEYLFLRVLQCYETVFLDMAGKLAASIDRVDDGDLGGAADTVDSTTAALRESAGLFRLLATMQVESFEAFRQETEGASAIQSESYKYFEATCAPPTPARLASPAFEQTPLTRSWLAAGSPTLLGALQRQLAAADAAEVPDGAARLVRAMRGLDDESSAWRITHVGLAARFLADQRGSGDTEGLPYLERVRHLRLFPELPEVRE